jgi:hypothetical protein
MSVTTAKQGTMAPESGGEAYKGGTIQGTPKMSQGISIIDYQPIGKCEESNEFELTVSNKRSCKVHHNIEKYLSP